jgi:hypothetical protein
MEVDDVIRIWSDMPISERADYQTFIRHVCAVIGVPAPGDERIDPNYTFERQVRFRHDDGSSTAGFIDCYRRGCFVLEAKQSKKRQAGGELAPQLELAFAEGSRARRAPPPNAGTGWDKLMRAARRQAEGYAKALDEWPPFLVIVDVGHCIELWADFSGQGKNYTPFPDRNRSRIYLPSLRDKEVRERLCAVWTDPHSLNPATRSAEVTDEIAKYLAELTRSLEARCPEPGDQAKSEWAGKVAMFLMQCIFAMFAEDVGLLPEKGFERLLNMYRGRAERFHVAAQNFFHLMDVSGHSDAIQEDIRRFNGGLFHDKPVIPVNEAELELLAKAAARNWKAVEPAIFGTLLEQALATKERAALGAHYTPRDYVERLVVPALIEPLRQEWDGVEASAMGLYLAGKVEAAQATVRAFHQKLCSTRVLDPACGTGNFLYVSLKLMKELEGDVLNVLAEVGDRQYSLQFDVTP